MADDTLDLDAIEKRAGEALEAHWKNSARYAFLRKLALDDIPVLVRRVRELEADRRDGAKRAKRFARAAVLPSELPPEKSREFMEAVAALNEWRRRPTFGRRDG